MKRPYNVISSLGKKFIISFRYHCVLKPKQFCKTIYVLVPTEPLSSKIQKSLHSLSQKPVCAHNGFLTKCFRRNHEILSIVFNQFDNRRKLFTGSKNCHEDETLLWKWSYRAHEHHLRDWRHRSGQRLGNR